MVLAMVTGILFLFFALGYYFGRRRKKRSENIGEAAVRALLTQYCRRSTAHLLNNITISFKDGTTQIDHILLTQNGILVIETKHYSGWLFVNQAQKYWTQVIYQTKNRFRNPIKQNAQHVSAVRNLLEFVPTDHIQGIVVFTGDAEFKTEVPQKVIHLDELVNYVDAMRSGSIAENMLQYCIGRIEHRRFELTAKTDIEHQRYLEQKFGTID
jgi:hypothetical protein